jgi:hypothetical protein
MLPTVEFRRHLLLESSLVEIGGPKDQAYGTEGEAEVLSFGKLKVGRVDVTRDGCTVVNKNVRLFEGNRKAAQM